MEVANMFTRTVLCVVVALCLGRAAAEGLDRPEEPAAQGRVSTFRVSPPTADARVFFEGVLMRGTGRQRTMHSPALEEGKRYTYTVIAVWVEKGQEVTHEMRVPFQAGEDVIVDFRR
jgi:uncharacterized protein (TIGR03000 family)